MNGIEEKAIDLLNKIESLVSQKSQPAWDTLVQIAQVSAIGDLAITTGLFVLAFSFGMVGWHILKTFEKRAEAHESWRNIRPFDERDKVKEPENPDEDVYYPFVCVAWFISGIFSICTTVMLFKVWMWVALVNPELAVARQIVEKFL